jgi:hypothetical protein
MLELATKSNINNWIELMSTSKCIDGIKKIERGDLYAAKEWEQMDRNWLMNTITVS